MHNVMWYSWFPIFGDAIEVEYFYDSDYEEDSLTMYEMQNGKCMGFTYDEIEDLCIFETLMDNAYNETKDPCYL